MYWGIINTEDPGHVGTKMDHMRSAQTYQSNGHYFFAVILKLISLYRVHYSLLSTGGYSFKLQFKLLFFEKSQSHESFSKTLVQLWR